MSISWLLIAKLIAAVLGVIYEEINLVEKFGAVMRYLLRVNMNFLYKSIEIVIYIFIFHMSYVSASEDMVLKKYIYGLRQYSQVNGQKYLPPAIELLPHSDLKESGTVKIIYPYYDMGDQESNIEKNKHQIDIDLSVQQKSSDVMAVVSFHNRGKNNYFVYKNRLSLNKNFMPLCNHAFSIASEGISLVYLGWRCVLETEDTNWVAIPSGKTFYYTVKLNDVYLFPPGKRRYNIGSLKFRLANDVFFHQEMIYKHLFLIFDWRYESCKINDYVHYGEKITRLCQVYNFTNLDSEGDILKLFGFESYKRYGGYDSNSYFEARSNQVIIEIDGDKLTSPYDMGTTRFSN